MKTISEISVMLLISTACASAQQAGSARQVPLAAYDLPTVIIQAALSQDSTTAKRSLFVDRMGFEKLGYAVGVSLDNIVRAVTDAGGQLVAQKDAIVCSDRTPPCYVRDNGVLMTIDSVKVGNAESGVVVASKTYNINFGGTHPGSAATTATYRIVVQRSGTGWVATSVRTIRTT